MLLLCSGALTILVLYSALLGWGWRRSKARTVSTVDDDLPAISVIIAARNESASLPSLLRALDDQTHQSFEVIIVDDASTDDTASIARSWATDRSSVRIVSVSDPQPPRKKHALSRGIDAAQHDLFAFTDADCTPPPTWLSAIAAAHANTADDTVFVGYSPVTETGTLGLFSRYEAFVEALYMMAAIGWNRPYMAVGRNLSYPRSVFEAVDGFHHSRGGQESISGDDDLFLQAIHRENGGNIRPLLDTRTFVPTSGPTSWRDWLRKRQRHVSAGQFYPWDVGAHLTLLHVSLVIVWLSPFLLGSVGFGVLAVGLLARHIPLGPAADTLEEETLLTGFPVWELGYALYHLFVVPWGLLNPPTRW